MPITNESIRRWPASYSRWLLWILVVYSGVRWLLIGRFELTGDEAYYWLWAQHLDWAYYSKGPGIALVIALSSSLLGDSELGVRCLAPLLIAGSAWGVFVLGRLLFDARAGFWSALLLLAMPLTAVGSLLQTIDPVSVCLWVWAMVWLAHALRRPLLQHWMVLGLLIGAGALAKYTNLMLLPGIVLMLLWSAPHRRLLVSAGFWAMLLCVLLSLAPVAVWQMQHEWITLTHLHERGALNKPLVISAGEFLEFLGLQLAVSWPVLPLWGVALYRARSQLADWRVRLLICMSLPLWLMYALMAFVEAGEANWTAPAYVAAAVLIAAQWPHGRQAGERRVGRSVMQLAIASSVMLLQALVVLLPFVGGLGGASLQSRLHGAQQLTAHMSGLADHHNATFLIADHYQLASLLTFYDPQHTQVYTPTAEAPRNQFYFWPGYAGNARLQGRDALFISRHDAVPDVLHQQFDRIERLPSVTPAFAGRSLRTYHVFVCRGLLGKR